MQKNHNLISQTSLPKKLGWLVHLLGWGIFLLFPFFFSGRHNTTVSWPDYWRFFVNFITVVIVFYANYLYLVKRFLFSRQIWHFVLTNFLIFSILAVATHFLMDMIPPPSNHAKRPEPAHDFKFWMVIFDYIKFTFAVVFSIAFKMTNTWYKTEAERKELEQSRSEAELQNLKNQLNPHFLFNTLNNIYSLIAISADRAQEAVHELSRLLRYVLYESNEPFVSIGKDLEFVRNYVELMRIRLPEHVKLKTSIQTTSPDTLIAPLLFITLIENAFKHGVSNNKPSFIEIEISADNKHLICDIRNSYFPKNDQDKSGSGIGLMNLEKRLLLLYPGKYSLNYSQVENMYICKLELHSYR